MISNNSRVFVQFIYISFQTLDNAITKCTLLFLTVTHGCFTHIYIVDSYIQQRHDEDTDWRYSKYMPQTSIHAMKATCGLSPVFLE